MFVIQGNQAESVPKDYQRYLENIFRKVQKLLGTPVRLEFKTSDNPYKDRPKTLTEAQAVHKRRPVQGSRKREKRP